MVVTFLVVFVWILVGRSETFAGTHIEKGLEFLRQGKLNEAEVEIKAALKSENQAEAYNILGIIYDRQGKNAEGQRAYLQSLKLNPGSAKVSPQFGQQPGCAGQCLSSDPTIRKSDRG